MGLNRRRRFAALGILAGTTILFVGALAAPATAEVIQPPCTGSVTFSDGTTVTEKQPLTETVEAPASDTVTYSGDTTLDPPSEPEGFSGSVALALPAGGSYVIVDWPVPSDATTEQTSVTDGTYTYTVPDWVPKGTGPMEVTATHTQRGQTCVVAVNFSVEGSPGGAAWLGAGLTVAAGAGMLAGGIKKKVV